MKKCFAVAISILIILMSCSEHKKVEKVLTWEDSVDMALKGYVYLNYPDSSLICAYYSVLFINMSKNLFFYFPFAHKVLNRIKKNCGNGRTRTCDLSVNSRPL